MWGAMLSSILPIATRAPVFGTFGWKTAVQLGGWKMASETSLPTLRRSMSKAQTTSMSKGRQPPMSQCIRPMRSPGDFFR